MLIQNLAMNSIFYMNCMIFCNLLGVRNCFSDTDQQFVITKLDINTDVRYRFAETVFIITVYNPSHDNQTYLANIPFPKEAFISNITIEINSEVFVSSVVEKTTGTHSTSGIADAKDKNIEYFADTNSFVLPVNISPKKDVTVTLTYQEVLKRQKGVYDVNIIVGRCDNRYNTNVKVSITETKTLTNVQVIPVWKDSNQGNRKGIQVARPTNETALIIYKTVANSGKCLQELHVEYDVERGENAGEILIEDGFFVHFLAPSGLKDIPKDIIFVLDTSESMKGQPIVELQSAMGTIFDKLGLKDRFNIIVFQTSFGLFESELQNVSIDTIFNAKNMINYQSPGGGTNIHDGLLAGIKMLHSEEVNEIRSPIIIFLTDGHASSGITNRDLITTRVKSRNVLGIPIFSISIGKEADSKLSSRIASQNFGFSRHVFNANVSRYIIEDLYNDVATTLMKHINIIYLDNVVNNQTVTQTKFRTLFNQSEIVISGKLRNDSTSYINSTVIGLGSSGLTLLSNASVTIINDKKSKNTLESIWRFRRLKEVMSIHEAIDDPKLAEALKETIIAMSLENNYITPLTAVVIGSHGNLQRSAVVDNDERTQYAAAYKVIDKSQKNKSKGNSFSGQGDPHFEVTLKGLDHPVCFDIKANPGAIIRILKSPKGMVINIGIIPETQQYRDDKLYISDIFVFVHGHKLLLNTEFGILYNGHRINWSHENCTETAIESLSMCFKNDHSVVEFRLDGQMILYVKRVIHMQKKYLNFNINYFTSLPRNCSGLLGYILQNEIEVNKVFERNGMVIGNFFTRSSGKENYAHIAAKLKQNQRSLSNQKLCWHIKKQIKELTGELSNFQIQSLFHSDILP